jgi:hypothetical protein
MCIEETCVEIGSCNKIDIVRYKTKLNTIMRYCANGNIEKGAMVVDEGMYQIGDR